MTQSANQLRRILGTTYKTAWFLSHRIREAMVRGAEARTLTGTVEVDETYIGGKPRYRRKGKRGYVAGSKSMVLGAVERGGQIRLRLDRRGANAVTLRQFIARHVDDATKNIYTDSSHLYGDLTDHDTTHAKVNHSAYEWVRGDVHTNTVEGVWSLLKRSIIGSYHHLSVKHLQSYLDEIGWRYNNRHSDYLFRDTLRALFRSDVMTYKTLVTRAS